MDIMVTKKYIKELSYKIIGCAIEVHKQLGPGILESVYQACMIEELVAQGLSVQSQLSVPISYKGKNLGLPLRIDLLVNDLIVVELKAVEKMIPLYEAQLLSYLKLTAKPKGLLINFNCDALYNQVESLVTDEYKKLPEE